MENYSNLEKLSNDLKNLFQNQNQNEKEEESYFDFEIICEQNQTSIKTHKSILSSRSEYFKSLFNSKMKEYQENKLILKDVSSSILSSILNYFYSGKIEINLENAIQILFFSSKYLIDELIEICSNFIKNNLQFETVVDILKLSEAMNFNQLIDSSYKFIFENFDKFIKTSFFLELEENHLNSILSNHDILINEFELFQSIIKWGKHKLDINQEKELEKEEKEKLQNQISNVIEKIRFIDFSKEELKDILKEDLIPKQISEQLIQFQKLQETNLHEKELTFQSRFKSSKIIQDNEYASKLQEWINDDKFFSKMKKGFSARRNGFSSKKWHKKVDNKGKTLVIMKTTNGFIFGGFTEVGFFPKDKSKWHKLYRNDDSGPQFDANAFIFSLRNDKNDRKPQKFTIKKGEEGYAIDSELDYGPCFGFPYRKYRDPDFALTSNFHKPGFSNFGSSYNLPNGIEFKTNEAKSYLAGSCNKWINSNEKIEETIKRIYLNEKDFIIERKEKQYKFPKLILLMRSELYRGMFLSVTNDTSNKVTDYSELSNKSFQIFEYWIYSNQIKDEIEITQEIINELDRGIDYFQLNQTNPNLFDLLIKKFNNQNQN
ncbi:pep-cterm sorting domain-containing protein [Anaeramoeba ignava]|uniref:Pep-cterm sorting domain-containing protein n=1 Tax=Anaeramoeba ignava TaxID=1746090 RepID=A0A9Q0R765_ANAIG|nr:pep-cterm sorting domain-containing protein [Anaeramoeba ignava]